MINWELFNIRNLLVIGGIALIALFAFNHFSKEKGNE